ncbi:D-3-phosphoglycerate dehydrogenase [Tremella mesenterica]|uniref:D-3-phosphoglycerate dehydrogenase n=1 Tax=Tremella mesenterica TaxID=5217 RepID=A0A4Q1BIN4_TREME|nr:D-3-phosphoglycerate dehydrogenase [Tremella mesenterica]
MNFFAPPPTLTAELVATVPQELYATTETEWLHPSTGKSPSIFLEGITTDPQGNIFVVDVPYGQVLKYQLKSKKWTKISQWEGEPNGLAVREDGMLAVADYKEGVLLLDPSNGKISKLITRRNMEGWKGVNDLIFSSTGDLYFTDQGQTGMSDPTGSVYRLSPEGRLDTLLSNGPSPNGLVLTPDERALYVAMTRENSVWRCPLHPDGTTTKVNKFFSSFGTAGPDGMTVDVKGNLFICHPSLACIFVVDPHGLPKARIVMPTVGPGPATVTNCIFGSTPEDRNRLYFVCAMTGEIYGVDWECEGAIPIRMTKEAA